MFSRTTRVSLWVTVIGLLVALFAPFAPLRQAGAGALVAGILILVVIFWLKLIVRPWPARPPWTPGGEYREAGPEGQIGLKGEPGPVGPGGPISGVGPRGMTGPVAKDLIEWED